MRLRGTVGEGTEPACLLLDAGGRTYVLLGVRRGSAPTGRATVVGRPDPERATTCQQGTPLLVESVREG